MFSVHSDLVACGLWNGIKGGWGPDGAFFVFSAVFRAFVFAFAVAVPLPFYQESVFVRGD
jgi:hypothetical protein